MVNRLKLNEKTVREAENLGRDYQIFDTDVRGFSITIYPSGNRSFTLDYRVGGRQRRMTIGRWPEWNTVAARERAKELRRDIDEGIDPLDRRESAREAPRVSDMITRYLAEHTPHLAPRNAADQHTIMHKLVAPDWGKKLVTEITKYDVEKLLNKIAAGRARPSKAKPNNRARKLQGAKPTPVRANRVPPGRVQGNGSYTPDADALIAGDLVLSWAHRDRLTQTSPVIVDHTGASIGPEPGVGYVIEIRWIDPDTGAAILPVGIVIDAGATTVWTLAPEDIPDAGAPDRTAEILVAVRARRLIEGAWVTDREARWYRLTAPFAAGWDRGWDFLWGT